VHLDVAESLVMLGHIVFARAKYAEAEGYYTRTLAIQEKAVGFEDRQLTSTLYPLAQSYVLQRKYVEAERYYRRFLTIQERVFGPGDPVLAFHLDFYAELLRRGNRGAEAAEVEARAKAIRAKRP